MKNRTQLIKLSVVALVIASPILLKGLLSVSAHEGHKKGHAPASAKRLRNPVEHNTANIENGKALFGQNCAVCHGADGKGAEYNQKAKIKVPDLTSHYVMHLTDGEIFYAITNGIKTSGMPAFKLKASDRERWQMVHYVKHFGMTADEHAAMTPTTPDAAGDAKTQEVTLRFKPVVGDKAFACGESYEGIGVTNSKIMPTDFRLYLHNVRLIDATGKEAPLTLEQDGKWQFENIALLDFENGSGPCANGTPDTNDVIKGKVPAGNYTGVRFTVGVPFERNHADPVKAPSPLNLTQLFWVWNTGYKFARIEMQTTGLPQGWFLHLGSTGCLPNETRQTLPTKCEFANRAEITLANFDPNRDAIIADLKGLLAGANADVNQEKTARGCMSAQNNADCAPLFANLGLSFAGKQSAGQRFFRAETGAKTASSGTAAEKAPGAGEFRWDLPAGFPVPKESADNPMTAAKVELGRHLFYDTRLSVNGTQSCASCHDQAKAFTDGKAQSVGATGEVHPRGAMSIVNIAYTPVLTWANPNTKQLERQALTPMFGEHPVELGLSGKENEVLVRLKAEPRYQKLFPESFANQSEPFMIENVTKAIAAFERTLISGDSPYDRYLNGDKRAISLSAKRGEALFFSERLECFHCHGGFNFSQTTDHVGKAFVEIEFHNTGLYNLDGKGAFPKDNPGTFEFTNREEDMGKFRAPTLRNIAVTAPYMHDGSIQTLEGVIDHYAAGGRTIRNGEFKGVGSANPNKSAFVKGFKLTPGEKLDFINFLKSLTDEQFLRDPRFANPWGGSAAGAIGAQSPKAAAELSVSPSRNPAATGSFSPHLTVTPGGKFLLSWVEPSGGKALALKYAIHQAGRWSAPRTVTASEEIVRYPSVPPVITALPGNQLIACWTQERRGGKGKWPPEDFHFSVSRDGGATWSEPRIVHGDLSESEHSFVSVAPAGADEITAIGLDGRTGKQSLMAAKIKTDGTVSDEKMIDADVCTCCPTTLAKVSGGLIAAYRDHEGETRDISFLRFGDGQWGEPQNLHRDGWKINGCPVNGPSLAAEERRVVAAWFTSANDEPRVNVAFSNDGGKTFGNPIRVDEGQPLGRAAVALLSGGGAVIAWVEKGAAASQLLVRQISADGKTGAAIAVGKPGKSFPRMVSVGGQAMLTWTAAGSVRTALLTTEN